ncbi:hypothetical protein EIP91_007219 [Steccherinum ochraceum]|uniref:Acetohydroxy-acid reductoisomerase n=1 Tax=Steccherinum ochraceum TaxID=92696 RepID=A0A4R0RIT7_9APHY|nr:hypothetical protein EIP91_007219 [Steccherinum ochraceum]
MPSAKIYYDSDADLGLLADKKIVFLGFGNQGAAQAQNLRDSGIPNDNILIANRADAYAEDAKSRGFHVEHDFKKAAPVADVLFILIPDQVQPRVFNGEFAPLLKDDVAIVIASGYNVFFKLLNFKPTQDVIMVAPRMIGSSVRSLYEKGKGFPCFVSAEQDGTGKALTIALALSRAIGATKAGAIASSAREETAMDLFAEQALWPNIILLFNQAFNVLQEAGCSDEALCYEMWMSKEPAEIFERAAEEGFITQLKHHSTVSQYGQLNGALQLDGSAIRKHFQDILHNQVLNGKFCKEFSKIEEDLEKDGDANPLNVLYKKHGETELGQAEDRVRSRDYDRDRDRDRERRRERDGGRYRDEESRHSRRDRDVDLDDGRDRRRKRGDEGEEPVDVERSKRRREDGADDSSLPPPPPSAGLPPPPPPLDRSPKSTHSRSRDYDRGHRDRPARSRDARDEFDDGRLRQGSRDGRPSRTPDRLSAPPIRPSPSYDATADDPMDDEHREDDSEARSVFVSQLAARLTARDLGYFFEEKLGEGSVMDSRIVTDRISRRSKGIGYVEFRTVELVDKAINLSGTVVMGLPIHIQHTEAERNRTHAGDGNLNLPPGVSARHGGMQLYVGSLHFNLTESDIKQVFEPFGELEFVDLHRDPTTGRSKGYAFVQYKRAEDAKMALEQMEGFELAGRTLRVNTVHEKGTVKYTQQDSLDEAGGGNLNAASRQALMQKLARIDQPEARPQPILKPNIPQAMQSRSVLLKNMFTPEDETERDWDKELAEDVKGECEEKYGSVEFIKVERDSEGEIYVKFDSIDSAKKAVQGLNGRWFGGNQVSANFISDAIMQAHQ